MNYDKLAVNLINKYIWQKAVEELTLTQNEINMVNKYNSGQALTEQEETIYKSAMSKKNTWEVSLWGNITPIFPVNENFGTGYTDKKPYLLYDYIVSNISGTFWPLYKEKVTYSIVGEIPYIYYTKNFIFEKLKKFDVSAQEVNKTISDSEINFKYIRVEQPSFIAQEYRPADSQLTKYQTTLVLTYEFTRS